MKKLVVFVILLLLASSITIQAQSSFSSMNYQGELRDSSGNPLTGIYNMRFCINNYNPSKVWPTTAAYEEHTAVSVSNGYFNVILGKTYPLDAEIFTGTDLNMKIWICSSPGSGCTTYELLTPSRKLTSVGYSLVAKEFSPGAIITGNTNILSLSSDLSTGSVLRLTATYDRGNQAALFASCAAPSGAALSAQNVTSGYGLYSESNGGYAVYSKGNLHVEGDLTWKAKTHTLSVLASSCKCLHSSCFITAPIDYAKACDNTIPEEFVATYTLLFPDGATITELSANWKDLLEDYNGYVILMRSDLTGFSDSPGSISTSGSDGVMHTSTTTISSIVDNSRYSYYLLLSLANGPEAATDDISIYTIRVKYTDTNL